MITIFIESLPKKQPVSPHELISKMVAVDGLPFSTVSRSVSIRYMYEASTNTNMPQSPNTIREIMLRCYEEKKALTVEQFSKLTIEGKRFSITLDEWTSAANKRYMNINLHGSGEIWNLGLSRITGTFSAEACLNDVKIKLVEFGLSLQKDMKKFGRLSGRKHFLCMAHAIHLAVVGLLYMKNVESNVLETTTEADEEEEDLTSVESPLSELESEVPEIIPTYAEVISRAKKIVKIFRNSPLKSEVLARYTDTGLTLKIDMKTRWNSLLDMLERVFRLKAAICKASIDCQVPLLLTENDFQKIDEIVQCMIIFLTFFNTELHHKFLIS